MKCTICETDIPIGQRLQVIDTDTNTGHWMDIYCYSNLDQNRYQLCETTSRRANNETL